MKQEHTREEHELVYEISWIKELGLWRSLLRSRNKVNADEIGRKAAP
jgi:hypothetical protein